MKKNVEKIKAIDKQLVNVRACINSEAKPKETRVQIQKKLSPKPQIETSHTVDTLDKLKL